MNEEALITELRRVLEPITERVREERFKAIGIRIDWQEDKPLEIHLVRFERPMTPAVNPPADVTKTTIPPR